MFKKTLLASAVLASTMGMANASGPTIYVGAGLGVNVNTSNNGVNNQPGYSRGVPFNVFAGYGGVIDQSFYLAGEVGGILGTGEFTDKNGLKTTYGYNISILPGFALSEHALVFARVGYARSQFTNVDEMGNGAQVGLGMQSSLTQNVDLRGEYDFTAYRNVGTISSPRQDMVNMSLIYKFE